MLKSDGEGVALQSRLPAIWLRYHYRCNGEIIGNACMRCGASGAYSWAYESDGKPATTDEYYPYVRFNGEQD
jgi:hypothetical protein